MVYCFFNKICTGIFELQNHWSNKTQPPLEFDVLGQCELANSLKLHFLEAKYVLPVHIQLGHCTNSTILISHLIMFHIWPHLALFFPPSLGILSPETGDQNYCQTCLTLAKQWAADKRACLSRLPLASLHAWHCPRLAWQCPAWHRYHTTGWKFTLPCHGSCANTALIKLGLLYVSNHEHRHLW